MRGLDESGMSHELFPAEWNARCRADLCSVHVCSCYRSCFFFSSSLPLVDGVQGLKDMLEKEGLFQEQSNAAEAASADCVVLGDVRAGPDKLTTWRRLTENRLLR